MHRSIKRWAVAAALVAVAIAALPVASSARPSASPEIRALQRQIKALKTQVSSVRSQVGELRSTVGTLQTELAAVKAESAAAKSGVDTLNQCVRYRVLGVAAYGAPSSDVGYLWFEGQDLYLTTALDVAPAGQQQAFLAVVNPSCAGSASALKLTPHRVDQR